jgi:hypothetical protein
VPLGQVLDRRHSWYCLLSRHLASSLSPHLRCWPLPQVVLALYPFLWLQLYWGLVKQRGKRLGPEAAAGLKKAQ